MAIWIEFIVGALLAIYFHWVLQYHEASYIVFGVGLLLSLATYLIKEQVKTTQRQLMAVYEGDHGISQALATISDSECQDKSHELLTDFKRHLTQLQQGYLLLNQSEFYLEGVKALEQSTQLVKAVDPLQVDWDSRGSLVNYYQANLNALKRQVKIIRIFVMNRRELENPNVLQTLQQQLGDGVEVRIAYLEDLQSKGSTVDSLDFAIYDDQIVTDRNPPNSHYFGKRTTQTTEIEKYQRLFNVIEHHSQPFQV
jgi:hypothetical protein